MKKVLYLVLLIFLSCNNIIKNDKLTNSGISNNNKFPLNLKDLSINEIPRGIDIKGKIIEAKSWIDKNGINIIVVSYSGPFPEKEIEFSSGEMYVELFAKQYIKKDSTFKVLWNIYDFERHCPFDLWIGLLPKSTSVTDLDHDGITETTLVYKLTCRSDVSPSRMKVIMHENNNKYGLRGLMISSVDTNKINLDSTFIPNLAENDTSNLDWEKLVITLSGRYENENDFKNAPPEFLIFARSKWLEFIKKDKFIQFK